MFDNGVGISLTPDRIITEKESDGKSVGLFSMKFIPKPAGFERYFHGVIGLSRVWEADFRK